MSKSNKYSLIRVSSEDKQPNLSQSNSQFVANLTQNGGYVDNVSGISVKVASVPNVFYNVPDDSNFLVFRDSGAPGVDKGVFITVGQYNVNQLCTALATAINSAITAGIVTVTLDPITQKLVFTSTTVNIQIMYDNSSIYDIIGLTQNSLSNLVVTMDSPVNLTGETEVFVHSSVIARARLTEADGNFSVLAVISLTGVPFGSYAQYQSNDEGLDYIAYEPLQSARTLQQIDITLRNRNGKILVLPNNFFFSIILQAYYK